MKYLLIILSSIALVGCDPVHDIKLENQSGNTIEVLYTPSLENIQINEKQIEKGEYQGRSLDKITLDSTETIRIGTVVARYIPAERDINLEYLEVRNRQDTIRLIGKKAILSTIQKVEKLDWRILIK